MRRKVFFPPYLFLGFFLFVWTDFTKSKADSLRSFCIASCYPVFRGNEILKMYLADRPLIHLKEKEEIDGSYLQKLETENVALKTEIQSLVEKLQDREVILEFLSKLEGIEKSKAKEIHPEMITFYERRIQNLTEKVRSHLIAMPAGIIYRDSSLWSSSFWIDVGDEDNETLGSIVIAKNSPVVSGDALVGVIDHVGKKQSRVRLLTDSDMTPAVRAVRKGSKGKRDFYLAKGVVQGSSAPLWRSRTHTLKGFGFNFDMPDEEGKEKDNLPLIQKGDLLVTSGYDGVLPPDIEVGFVTSVESEKTHHTYAIEVCPKIEDFNSLRTVFVLPPRSD